MPPSYQIRLAEEADLTYLHAVERAAARLFPAERLPDPDDVMPMEELERAAANGLLWIAVGAGEVIGFAMAKEEAGLLHLAEVAVHPDHGRRGVGTQLVRAVIRQAVERRLGGVTLTTFCDLPFNAPFYAKLGFRILDPAELSPMLRDILAEEARLGMTNRVAMRYSIGT